MIIPVKCFTCGKVIADKWLEYEKRVNSVKAEQKQSGGEGRPPAKDKAMNNSADGSNPANSIILDAFRGKILDDLGMKRICCRRHMLTHVDLIDII